MKNSLLLTQLRREPVHDVLHFHGKIIDLKVAPRTNERKETNNYDQNLRSKMILFSFRFQILHHEVQKRKRAKTKIVRGTEKEIK
jgi:hypothetical protein